MRLVGRVQPATQHRCFFLSSCLLPHCCFAGFFCVPRNARDTKQVLFPFHSSPCLFYCIVGLIVAWVPKVPTTQHRCFFPSSCFISLFLGCLFVCLVTKSTDRCFFLSSRLFLLLLFLGPFKQFSYFQLDNLNNTNTSFDYIFCKDSLSIIKYQSLINNLAIMICKQKVVET